MRCNAMRMVACNSVFALSACMHVGALGDGFACDRWMGRARSNVPTNSYGKGVQPEARSRMRNTGICKRVYTVGVYMVFVTGILNNHMRAKSLDDSSLRSSSKTNGRPTLNAFFNALGNMKRH